MQPTISQSDHNVPHSSASLAAQIISLSADQITAAIDEASQNIDALTVSFLSTVCQIDLMLQMARKNKNGNARDSRANDAAAVGRVFRSAIKEATKQLQFGDRLCQRLVNVCRNLNASAEFLHANDGTTSDVDLAALLADIESSFTMQPEREMFDSAFPASADTSKSS